MYTDVKIGREMIFIFFTWETSIIKIMSYIFCIMNITRTKGEVIKNDYGGSTVAELLLLSQGFI